MPLPKIPTTSVKPPQNKQDVNPKIMPEVYRHAIVDTRQIPLASLITYMEGSNWTTTYYGQVIGADQSVADFDPNQASAYLQYTKIERYIMKLQGSLSESQEATNNVFTVTGSALMYPFLKPNVGDVFIADVGDGKAGQFKITNVLKKTLFTESVFEIEFVMARYCDKALEDKLNSLVVNTYFFKRDFLHYGQNPMLTQSQVHNVDLLGTYIKQLRNEWLSEFYSHEHKTILVGGQKDATYDPFVTKTILRMFNTTDHPDVQHIRELNCDDFNIPNTKSIWDALLNQDVSLLRLCFSKIESISRKRFRPNPNFNGIRFSRISYVIVPDNGYNNVDKSIILDAPFAMEQTDRISELMPANLKQQQYLFSEAFYKQEQTQCAFENMVLSYLNNKIISPEVIYPYVTNARSWSSLERFYYIPIILILMQVSLRTIE